MEVDKLLNLCNEEIIYFVKSNKTYNMSVINQ